MSVLCKIKSLAGKVIELLTFLVSHHTQCSCMNSCSPQKLTFMYQASVMECSGRVNATGRESGREVTTADFRCTAIAVTPQWSLTCIDSSAAQAVKKTRSCYNRIGPLDNRMDDICFLSPHKYSFLYRQNCLSFRSLRNISGQTPQTTAFQRYSQTFCWLAESVRYFFLC